MGQIFVLKLSVAGPPICRGTYGICTGGSNLTLAVICGRRPHQKEVVYKEYVDVYIHSRNDIFTKPFSGFGNGVALKCAAGDLLNRKPRLEL